MATKYLSLARGVQFPETMVTEKIAYLGKTGGGKTYTAMLAAEQMLHINAQIVTLDAVGKWHGLRTLKNGKKGFPIPVFGGLYGDIPLLAESGKLIADLIVDKNISAILDVSQFETDAQKTKFSTDFSARFYFRKKAQPSPIHLFLEEAQEFVPQNPQKGEEVMLHNFQRIWKLGRNFGIGGSLISQRPQELNKKALNQSECIFAFQMTGPHEKKAIRQWVVDEKGLNAEVENLLPRLKQGECWLWSPSWLNISKQVKINEKETIDISATPKMGTKAVKPQELSSSEMKKIAEAMSETIEKAKENDPAELKKELAQLRKELQQKKYGKATVVANAPSKDTIARENELKWKLADAESKLRKYEATANSTVKTLKNILVQSQGISYKLEGEIQSIEENTKNISAKTKYTAKAIAPVQAPVRVIRTTIVRGPNVKTKIVHDPNSSLGKCERNILIALAQKEKPATRNQVAILAGYAKTSGSFNNAISRLNSNGYINKNGEVIDITQDGLNELGEFTPLPTGADLQTYWLTQLGKAESAILAVLIEHYPTGLEKQFIADQCNYAVTSGSFLNSISKLRTLELAEGKNEIIASDSLFN